MAENGEVPVGSDETRLFLLTLLSFHPEKKVTAQTPLSIALVKGQPTVLVNGDPTSFRKCLVAI